MKTELKAFHIDRDFVLSHDVGDVMAPVRLRANFWEGPEAYEASLAGFSREQRWFFALYWYDAEINNGGHHQFYWNSTGLVWEDALAGLHAVGLPEAAAILRESADRLGGSPPLDREERQAALERLAPDFNDLDTRYYGVRGLDERMKAFMRTHPEAFVFEGSVEVPVPEPAGGRRGIDVLMDDLMAVLEDAQRKAGPRSTEGTEPDGSS